MKKYNSVVILVNNNLTSTRYNVKNKAILNQMLHRKTKN